MSLALPLSAHPRKRFLTHQEVMLFLFFFFSPHCDPVLAPDPPSPNPYMLGMLLVAT